MVNEKGNEDMSRIGKLPVKINQGVEVAVGADNNVSVKSGQNVLNIPVNPAVQVKVADGSVVLSRQSDEPKVRAWHGLYRALIQNAVTGVSEGWTKTLVFKGVGYKAVVGGENLDMSLGYSHPIKMKIPKGLKVQVEKTQIKISGADRAQVGQFSAQIRSLRKPEPYLGKGIRYSDEVIQRKAGKSGGGEKK